VFKPLLRRRRGAVSVLTIMAVVSVAAVGLLASSAGAITANPPANGEPVSLTFVGGTTNLATPGPDTLTFHVDTTSGATLNGAVTSRICSPAPPLINNGFDFGFQGTRCVKPGGVQSGTGLTGANYSKAQGTFTGLTTTGNLTHNVGTGTVVWVNDTPTGVSLTCDSSNPCDLVVEVNIKRADNTGAVVYFEQQFTFAAPATNPGPVQNLTASAGNAQVSLDWDQPAFDGNSAIDDYEITRTPAFSPNATIHVFPATSYTDNTVINGTQYSYEVVAHNAAGFSSTPASVGPVTPNLAFRNVQQPITVTRPAGDLVMTQECNGAPNIYPDESLAPGDIDTLPGPVTYGAPTQTGCTIALGSAKLIKDGPGAGQFFLATGAINPVTVVDGRDNDPGWVSEGSVSKFTRQGGGPVAEFSGNNLGWDPDSTDTGALSSDDGPYDQTVVPGGVVTPKVTGTGVTPGAGLMTTPGTLAAAASGVGLGIARLDAALTLLIPINAKTGNYLSLMTITVV
jgi:hypothetical protein